MLAGDHGQIDRQRATEIDRKIKENEECAS